MPTLLLVDDDESTRLICRRFFRKQAGMEVELAEASTGEEAIDRLHGPRVDCVLSDYRMGGATGLDVLETALREQPHACRILMSGFADPALREAAEARAKVHAFIEKPIALPDFEAILARDVLPLLQPAAEGSPDAA